MDAANTPKGITWYSGPLNVPDPAMASYAYRDPTGGLSSQLIIDACPLPEKPMWSLNQTEPIPPNDKIYRVLDLASNADLIKDIRTTPYAILYKTDTNEWTYIHIQDFQSARNNDGSSGVGFKLTFTYVDLPPKKGGKSLYFKTKSTRKSSRRKYFKQKSSKRRIRTKSKYRRQ